MIVYCQGTYGERIPQTLEAYKRLGPQVDRRVVIVDETVTDKQLEQLHALNIETYLEKWTDDFPAMRNAYLAKCQTDDWVIVSDPDEWFCDAFCMDVRKIIAGANKDNIVQLKINSHDICEGVETKSDFYKDLIFKYRDGVAYKNPIHEELVISAGIGEKVVNLKDTFYYVHYRTRNEILERAARNVFIGGGGRKDDAVGKAWNELVKICTRLSITTWADFKTYLQYGQIDHELGTWILQHRTKGPGWQCEMVDLFRWYYEVLHPEENKGNWLVQEAQPMNVSSKGEEAVITDIYRRVLGREPDASGMTGYTDAMKRGATAADVEAHVRASDEARQRGKGNIVYCQGTYGERIWQTKEAVKRMAPNVDRVVVIVDQTTTAEQKKELRDIGPNVEVFMFPWNDNFPEMRNHYLEQCQPGDWVIVSDPDEWFNDNFTKAIRSICAQADIGGVRMLLINAHDIIHEKGKPDNEILSQYYKNLIFKYTPGTKYVGCGVTKNVHEVINLTSRGKDVRLTTVFWYEHHKYEHEIWERAMRNVYIGGGGNNVGSLNTSWRALIDICGDLHIFNWNELRGIMRAGNIDERLKYWLNHNRRFGYDYQNEMVDGWKWYFVYLHPEENVDHLEPLPANVDDKKIIALQHVEKETIRILGRNATTEEKEKIATAIMEGLLINDGVEDILKDTDEYKRLHPVAEDTNMWERAMRITQKAELNGSGNDRSDPAGFAAVIGMFKAQCPPETFKRVLDQGAGAGAETKELIKAGYNVVGTTFGKDNLKIAKEEFGVDLVEMDMHDLLFPAKSFDAIFTVQVFEHAFAPWLAILEARRVLRDGGRVFLDLPSADEQSMRDVIWHTSVLYPMQWDSLFWKAGFKKIASLGDKNRYDLVYEKLPDGTFEMWQYLQHIFK